MTESNTHVPVPAHRAHALVATKAAARYAKQLASHLGRKAEVRIEAEGPRIVLTLGSCLLVTGEHTLELRACADTVDGLEQVQQVVGSHLERFGQREGLTVDWTEPG